MRLVKRRARAARASRSSVLEPLETRRLLASIGLNFGSQEVPPSGNGLDPTHVAGVVPQGNWNNLRNGSGSEPGGGSGIGSIVNNAGAATGLGVSWTGQGTWRVKFDLENPAPGDEEMAMSAVFDHFNGSETGIIPVTITGVPYAQYDVYVYTVGDNDRDFVDIEVNGQVFYGVNQPAQDQLDGDPNTPFVWTQITGTNPSTTDTDGRNGGNYALFSGLSGSNLSITLKGGSFPPVFEGPYNTTISGIQIVERVSGAGVISGNVFNDPNSNGIKDGPDSNIAGWQVYLDTNNNNVRDGAEVTATTDANGNYSFTNLADGTYNVKQVLQSGYRKTNPGSGIPGYSVAISGGNTVTGRDFGNTTNIRLAGVVYNDANNNGVQDGNEQGISGVTVDIISNSTVVATRVTDASGAWRVQGLSAGTGEAKVTLPNGFVATAPIGGVYAGSMSSGQQNANLNFGIRQAAPAPVASFSTASILAGAEGDSLIEDLV